MRADNDMLERAISFANAAHKGQSRKGDKRPYITHPLAVMLLIHEYKKSANIIMLMVCAVLHDVLEDCPSVTMQMIVDNFGTKVASIVDELTDHKPSIKKFGKRVYQLDKWNSISSYSFVLKLADRLHNLRDLCHLPTEAARKQKADTKWILKRLDRKLTKTHKALIKDIKKEL